MPNLEIMWTKVDEAPALATYSLLPIVKAFASAAGVSVTLKDISLAGRILASVSDKLPPAQRLNDELAELGEFVFDTLRGRELVGDAGEDATGQRNVLQLHGHTRRAHESFDNRQQRIGRERRGFVDLCPHDFEIWHACTSGRRACLGRPETEHWRARGFFRALE